MGHLRLTYTIFLVVGVKMSENQTSTFGDIPHIKKTLLTALTNSAMWGAEKSNVLIWNVVLQYSTPHEKLSSGSEKPCMSNVALLAVLLHPCYEAVYFCTCRRIWAGIEVTN